MLNSELVSGSGHLLELCADSLRLNEDGLSLRLGGDDVLLWGLLAGLLDCFVDWCGGQTDFTVGCLIHGLAGEETTNLQFSIGSSGIFGRIIN